MGCLKAFCTKNQLIPLTGTGVFKISFQKPCHFYFLVSINSSSRFFVEISPYDDTLKVDKGSEKKSTFDIGAIEFLTFLKTS